MGMALRKLVRSNYGEKSLGVSNMKMPILLKKGVILLCQSNLDTKRISHLPGSPHFTIPLNIKTEEWDLKVLFLNY